jgi:integrase
LHDLISSSYPEALDFPLMPVLRITATAVADMESNDTLWDNEVRGFGVRHRARDAVYLLKTRIRGRQRILTIGRHGRGAWGPESARREAIRLLGLIRDGRDPATERAQARTASTFSELAARFMDEHAAAHHKPRTRTEAAGLLRLHLVPHFGGVRICDVGKADVARFHSALRATPVTANRALALLSSMLSWAERVGERPDGTNPCRHVARYREHKRERLLSSTELAGLGEALNQAGHSALPSHGRLSPRRSAEDPRALAAIRLLLFTGARRSEILTLRWEYIEFEQGIARLPDSKTGAKTLYLPPGALSVLSALPRLAGNPFALPGDRPGAHFFGIDEPWKRIRRAAGLPQLRLHDLRHAFASVAVASGDSLFIVGKLLGHRHAATTQRYAHLAPDPLRSVANRVGGLIEAMLTPKVSQRATRSEATGEGVVPDASVSGRSA